MELARPLSLLSWELGTWNLELGICPVVRSESERMNWISHDGLYRPTYYTYAVAQRSHFPRKGDVPSQGAL